MGVIQKANKLIKEGKLKYVSGNNYGQTYDIDGYIVKIMTKAGRVEDSCSCQNHARFCNINPRCSHKLALSTYLVMRNICIDCGDSINPHRDYKAMRCSCKEKVKRSGYIVMHVKGHPRADKNNYVFEHILVVEKKIGRYLKEKELVHHIDENKLNNKIENLMLFESNSKHQKFHHKIRQFGFTTQILKQIENRWKDNA